MQFKSYLLDFSHFVGSHTGEKRLEHTMSVIDKFQLREKVFYVVTDNAANMLNAFKDISGIVGETECIHEDDESDSETAETSEDADSERSESSSSDESIDTDDLEELIQCDGEITEQVLDYIGSISQKRLPCAIHTIQLVVLDGLKGAKFLTGVQAKASRLSTVLHTSGTLEQKYFSVFKKTIPRTTNTRWNSLYLQLSTISQLDSSQLNKLLAETKHETCIMTKRELDILREVVEVLAPAYNATLVMEEETALLSLVAPTVTQLHRTWGRQSRTVKFCSGLVGGLTVSLERRFEGLLVNLDIIPPKRNSRGEVIPTDDLNFGDPAYLISAALDPEFRLNWLGGNDNLMASITG
jgi:ABC-type transporter Mla MlaB component